MQTFSLWMKVHSPNSSTSADDRKVADGVVRDDGTCQLTFAGNLITQPQEYESIEQLQAVHCGSSSKVRLVF